MPQFLTTDFADFTDDTDAFIRAIRGYDLFVPVETRAERNATLSVPEGGNPEDFLIAEAVWASPLDRVAKETQNILRFVTAGTP